MKMEGAARIFTRMEATTVTPYKSQFLVDDTQKYSNMITQVVLSKMYWFSHWFTVHCPSLIQECQRDIPQRPRLKMAAGERERSSKEARLVAWTGHKARISQSGGDTTIITCAHAHSASQLSWESSGKLGEEEQVCWPYVSHNASVSCP